MHLGFKCSKVDSLLFIFECDRAIETILLLLYVDDIIITGSSSELIANIFIGLGGEYAINDLGPLHFLRKKVLQR